MADAQKAAKENEDAKAQLFTLKKQMTKANLEAGRSSFNNQQSGMNLSFSESGPGAHSGAGLISAEKYEEMIKQLNAELGASDGKLQSTLKELSDAQQRIVELGSVEEELVLTKAAAEDLSIEKHAQATSAAEAAERSLRMLASKEGAVREVMALERELEQSKRELEYCRNEVSKEKIRNKTLYAEKLGAERLAAEKTALCSKIEGELESAKNNIIEKEYELEHQKRRERELESTVESTKLTLWQVADETGCINLCAYDLIGDTIRQGDILLLRNGYCSLHRNELSLYVGAQGRLEKVGTFTMQFVEEPNMSKLEWQAHATQSGAPTKVDSTPRQ